MTYDKTGKAVITLKVVLDTDRDYDVIDLRELEYLVFSHSDAKLTGDSFRFTAVNGEEIMFTVDGVIAISNEEVVSKYSDIDDYNRAID